MIGAITTYLVILIQFDSSFIAQSNSLIDRNCTCLN